MEDLIEFFEFIPVNFVNELDTEITTLILSELKNDTQLIHELCKKNMFIFKNFVLRNILSFPKSIKYERKKTDLVCEDISFDLYNETINKQAQLITEIQAYDIKIKKLETKNKNLNKILGYEKDIQETLVNIYSVKDKYSRLLEYVNLHMFYKNDEENFNCLLEYREIRGEILKKEWQKLKMLKPYLYDQNIQNDNEV